MGEQVYICKYCHGTKPVHGSCTETNYLRAELATARLEASRLRTAIEDELRQYDLDDEETRENLHHLIAALEEP